MTTTAHPESVARRADAPAELALGTQRETLLVLHPVATAPARRGQEVGAPAAPGRDRQPTRRWPTRTGTGTARA